MQKRLNRSICHLGRGNDWAERCTSSIVFPGGANLPDDNVSSVSCAKVAEVIDAVWAADSGMPKEAQVQSYSPGCTNVQSSENTLLPPGNTIEPFVCGGDAPYVKLL